jgi:hypothetical protein
LKLRVIIGNALLAQAGKLTQQSGLKSWNKPNARAAKSTAIKLQNLAVHSSPRRIFGTTHSKEAL